ncbi:MAG: type II secretion system F family protein [Actinomycetota bacterium]|nr:type II secretion system F family protein [Actinomycetota bacterium]
MYYYLALLTYFMSFSVVSYVLVSIAWPAKKTILREQLSFYEQSWRQAHAQAEPELDTGTGLKARLKRLIVKYVSSRGSAELIEKRLEMSGIKMDWSEFVFYHLLFAIGSGAIGYMISGVVAAILLIIISAWLPLGLLHWLTAKRRAAFEGQLPETLTMLSGSLKAGYSLLQAVDMVSQEITPPLSDELKRVLGDARLGLPVEEALEKMSGRMASKNFEWMVLAVKIQREVGGNLAEVFSTLAATIRERETLLRQIKALTAEGRLSAAILLALPIVVTMALYIVNRPYIMMLFSSGTGWAMTAFALIMMALGSYWLRRVVKIEV